MLLPWLGQSGYGLYHSLPSKVPLNVSLLPVWPEFLPPLVTWTFSRQPHWRMCSELIQAFNRTLPFPSPIPLCHIYVSSRPPHLLAVFLSPGPLKLLLQKGLVPLKWEPHTLWGPSMEQSDFSPPGLHS